VIEATEVFGTGSQAFVDLGGYMNRKCSTIMSALALFILIIPNRVVLCDESANTQRDHAETSKDVEARIWS
jgi:hypothetical protein